jgi:REP element-mobilizing transposase RayT
MPQWDYSSNGVYFITLVTQNRECNLGQIARDGRVETHGRASLQSPQSIQLSDFGKIVDAEWLKSFEIRDELFLDEYIIMPNHLHAIVVLNNTQNESWTHGVDGTHVETHGRASLQPREQPKLDESPQPLRKPKSISSFIAGFKSAINSKVDDYIDGHRLNIPKYNRNNHFFQPNYHDHIIRNNVEYQRIKEYIINNPMKWNEDKLNSSNNNTSP